MTGQVFIAELLLVITEVALAILALFRLRLALREQPMNPWRVLRNGSLALLAIVVIPPSAVYEKLAASWLIVLAALVYSALIGAVIGVVGVLARRKRSSVRSASPPPRTDPAPSTPLVAGDPGWKPALSLAARGFNPFRALRQRQDPPPDGLTTIRLIYIGMAMSIPLYVLAFSFIERTEDELGPANLIPLLAGLAALITLRLMHRRPLNTSSAEELAASFRNRLFVSIGVGSLPALIGIAVTFVTTAFMSSIVTGAVLSIGCLLLHAPSRRNIARDQERIREEGSSLDLTAVLMTQPPQPPEP